MLIEFELSELWRCNVKCAKHVDSFLVAVGQITFQQLSMPMRLWLVRRQSYRYFS